MIEMPTRFARSAGAAALLAVLAACGPTQYEPAASPRGTGYTTTQLSSNRYLISFQGNAATARQTVETYLLFRAAEVAEQTGHPYFALVEHDVERDVDVNTHYFSRGFYGYGPSLGFGPSWGYPYYGTFGYAGGPMVTTSDSYQAFAAVHMFDARPEGREDVFETEDVLTTLRPRIEFPE